RSVATGGQESGDGVTAVWARRVRGGHSVAGGEEVGDPLVVVGGVPGTRGDGSVSELLAARAWSAGVGFIQRQDESEQLGDLPVGGHAKLVGAFGHSRLPPELGWLVSHLAPPGRVPRR